MFLVAAAAHLAIVLYSRTTLAASVWQVTRAEKNRMHLDRRFFQRPQQLLLPSSCMVELHSLHSRLLSGRLPKEIRRSRVVILFSGRSGSSRPHTTQ